MPFPLHAKMIHTSLAASVKPPQNPAGKGKFKDLRAATFPFSSDDEGDVMRKVIFPLLFGSFFPSLGYAHEAGHGGGFMAGLSHPVFGLDHF